MGSILFNVLLSFSLSTVNSIASAYSYVKKIIYKIFTNSGAKGNIKAWKEGITGEKRYWTKRLLLRLSKPTDLHKEK